MFLGAKRLGGVHVLQGVWRRLGLDEAFQRLLFGRRYRTDVERLLFALTANRALDPGSKLALEDWVKDDTFIDGLDEVEDEDAGEEADADADAAGTGGAGMAGSEAGGAEPGGGGLRKRSGHSKDRRPDLPLVTIGFAVTRDGIPVRCWVWPGNTVDVSLVEEVKRDLNLWKLGRVVLVLDTGFNSQANRRILQGAGDAADQRSDVLGEKLRLGRDGALPEALKRAGRFKTLESGLKIKEVTSKRGSVVARRFVVVLNPEQAERDKAKREDIVAETQRRLAELTQHEGDEADQRSGTKKACELRAHRTFGRYVKQDKNGRLSLDRDKVAREAKCDGKYLLTTSDPELSAEDVVLGYEQLQQVERAHRDLEHVVDVRPVYHRLEERIKAHVLLCWLALLLIRVAENETATTWHQLRNAFRPLMAGYHASPHGPIIQSNPLTAEQKRHLEALRIDPPPRYLHIPGPKATPTA